MDIKFSDIENAFEFVSSSSPYMHSAILCRETGQTYYHSEMGDLDEMPDGWESNDRYITIPHKNELDLGRDLVFRFIEEKLPNEIEKVGNMFRNRGAYSRYKAFLERKNLLDEWFVYENENTKIALAKWCKENGIECAG